MTSGMRSSTWFIAAACAALATLPAVDAAAFCRMTTMGNGQVEDPTVGCDEVGPALEWNDACISYAIDGRGSQFMSNEDIEEAIDLAFEEWENVDCGGNSPPNVVFTPLQSSNCRRAEYNCDGNVNTVAFLNPWRDPCKSARYSSAAFAVTLVFFNTQTGEILCRVLIPAKFKTITKQVLVKVSEDGTVAIADAWCRPLTRNRLVASRQFAGSLHVGLGMCLP